MRTICIINHKGGAAKTTTAVNLSASLASQGRRVLVVDLDPQASASLWFGHRVRGDGFLDAVSHGRPLDELIEETADGVSLVPCGPSFASFERIVAYEPGAEGLLRQSLGALSDDWDYVFLDCPPSLNLTSINALAAADFALVPVVAQVLSLDPLARLLDTMWQVRERFHPDLQLAGIFACRVDHRTTHSPEVVRLLRQQFAENVFENVVRENVHVAEAAGHQRAVISYAARSNGAKDYLELAEEFEERLEHVSTTA